MTSEIHFSFQELLCGDDWHLWDTFPTTDNNNLPDPTIEMNHNGLTLDSDPLLMTTAEQWLLSSTNDEQSETASHDEYLEVPSLEEIFTYEELLHHAAHISEDDHRLNKNDLSVDVIDERLKRRKYENYTGETKKCVICQTKLKYGEEGSKLACGHEFHFDCIKKWLMVKNMCPLCKQKVI